MFYLFCLFLFFIFFLFCFVLFCRFVLFCFPSLFCFTSLFCFLFMLFFVVHNQLQVQWKIIITIFLTISAILCCSMYGCFKIGHDSNAFGRRGGLVQVFPNFVVFSLVRKWKQSLSTDGLYLCVFFFLQCKSDRAIDKHTLLNSALFLSQLLKDEFIFTQAPIAENVDKAIAKLVASFVPLFFFFVFCATR